jgi:hypothetical protein
MLVPSRPNTSVNLHWIRSSSAADTLFILVSLAGFLLAVAGLGALGFGVGLHVGPIGEDYVWIDWLQRGRGAEAARLSWALNYRNPLSPWWYIAARELILNFDAGLMVLRYAFATLLAFSSYLLVITIAGRRARPFALALAVLILFWVANRFTDQLVWNVQAALAASLLSVATYARFLTGGRRSYHLYSASLVLWFVAFATYSIQCGAALAIGYLALRDALSQSSFKLATLPRLGRAAMDVVPYIVLFGLFILIWQTTMGPLADAVSLKYHVSALVRSLQQGLWNRDLIVFYRWVLNSPDRLAFVAAALACSGLAFLALQWRAVRSSEEVPGITGSSLVDLVIVIACLALPTVLLEAGSSTWTPGTRWPMIYQVTTPAFLLALVSVLALGLPSPLRERFWNGAVALAIGIGALFSLGHNRVQNAFITNENFIRNNIQRLIADDRACGRNAPTQVLLMLGDGKLLGGSRTIEMDGGAYLGDERRWWRSLDVLSPVIARVWFPGVNTSFRLVPWAPPPYDDWRSWWRVRFGPDSEGIGNAKVGGGTVPYDQVAILEVHDGKARRITHLDRQDVGNWDVNWAREAPIDLSLPLCRPPVN